VIFVGLGCFGLVMGVVAGLSQASGISTSLMTGLFAFAGGALVTYTGLAKPSARDAPPTAAQTNDVPDPKLPLRQIGACLTGLSAGVMAGLLVGLWLRYGDPLGFNHPSGPTATGSTTGVISLNAGPLTGDPTFERVVSRLKANWYNTAKDPLTASLQDLGELSTTCVQKCGASQ
jgi:hypothetical protein